MAIRVLITDDHALVRDALADYLQHHAGIEIVGLAAGGEQAESLCAELAPDVLLMDVSMPGIGGVEATRRIHEKHPCIKVIGLSMVTDERTAAAMREAGAILCVSKDTSPWDLAGVIYSVV